MITWLITSWDPKNKGCMQQNRCFRAQLPMPSSWHDRAVNSTVLGLMWIWNILLDFIFVKIKTKWASKFQIRGEDNLIESEEKVENDGVRGEDNLIEYCQRLFFYSRTPTHTKLNSETCTKSFFQYSQWWGRAKGTIVMFVVSKKNIDKAHAMGKIGRWIVEILMWCVCT